MFACCIFVSRVLREVWLHFPHLFTVLLACASLILPYANPTKLHLYMQPAFYLFQLFYRVFKYFNKTINCFVSLWFYCCGALNFLIIFFIIALHRLSVYALFDVLGYGISFIYFIYILAVATVRLDWLKIYYLRWNKTASDLLCLLAVRPCNSFIVSI